MINETNFIVRKSGRRDESYYIDYQGIYKITEISKVVDVEASIIRERYIANKGEYDQGLDVFYFGSLDDAKKTIREVLKHVKAEQTGRVVFLTEGEIEYIRQALINEGVNTLHVSSSVKDGIFRKLNR